MIVKAETRQPAIFQWPRYVPLALSTLLGFSGLAALASSPASGPASRPGDGVGSATFESGGKKIAIECFLPADGNKHPVVVLLHGGEGMEHPKGIRAQAAALVESGLAVVLPHYFERTETTLVDPAAIRAHLDEWKEAVADAITWAIQHPQVDANHIALVGHSLGAALALAQGVTDTRVQAVVAIAGGLGARFSQNLTRLPALLVLQGQDDPVTPAQRARDLEKLWQEHKTLVEVHIYPGQVHVLKGEAANDARRQTVEFLKKTLQNTGPGTNKAPTQPVTQPGPASRSNP